MNIIFPPSATVLVCKHIKPGPRITVVEPETGEAPLVLFDGLLSKGWRVLSHKTVQLGFPLCTPTSYLAEEIPIQLLASALQAATDGHHRPRIRARIPKT